ncbi:MAG: SusC/RagA family TonB-linked outer membrane protein [Cyclobacteriaceae bacterium]|nr:SusC/RagA family TonB-linked outer membrane protein [Cyclobacteriaceae bacterium]
MNKFYFIIRFVALFLFLGTSVAFAQKSVTGKVTSGDDGSALPGVNILEKGTNNGAVADSDGNYTISVGNNATLVFSFVGFTSQEIVVGNQTNINVALESDIRALSEVVVIGYGTQQKKEITSAVASVSADQFNTGNVTSPASLIAGKVAGLSVVRPGGDPNQSPTLRLRGITTFGGNSEPLVVIDGIVGASLDNVDPNDIASMDVLKDGSAAAIYGARGSSGVILITTKSGKSGKGSYANINYNGFVSIDQVANKIDVLSPEEFVNRGGTDFGTSTNWFDELTQNGSSLTQNISVEGGSGNTSFRGAVNYRDNQGIVKGVNFQRLNTRLSVSHNAINGKLRLTLGLTHNDRDQESINLSAFRYAVIYNPTAPVFEGAPDDANGGYFQRPLFDFYNPVALSKQQQFVGERKNTLTNYRVEYDLIDNLTLAVNYSTDKETGLNGSYWSKKDLVTGAGSLGQARRDTYDNSRRLIEATAKYAKGFGDLNTEFLLGFADQKQSFEGFAVQTRQFLYDYTGFNGIDFGAIRNGSNTEASSYASEDVLRSTFGRVNLNYKGTYFLSASVRSESFSGFGENEKSGIFPAVSAGVQLTDLFSMGPVSTLKVRASYGVTGNLPPASNLAIASFGPGGILDFDGDPLTSGDQYVSLRQLRDPNPTLKWETKKELNFGVDFGLFDGRLSGSMEYYTRDISDLLYGVNIPTGAPNPFDPINSPANVVGFAWANIGTITSSGFEFSASYSNVKLGPVNWTPSFNFTFYQKANIESFRIGDLGPAELRLATPGSPGQNNNEIIRNIPGQTLGNMYGPIFRGIDENGAYVLSTTNPNDFVVVGNGLPDGEFGFTNNFSYKNWDLSFVFRGAFGHDLYNSYRGFYENRDPGSNTWNSVVTDKTPYVTSPPTFSSLYVEDASFIRLDNLSLGYNLPTKGDIFSNVRIYATGQNLLTITNYTGIDPEVRYSDSENGDRFTASLAPGLERRNTYFTTRTFTLGVSLKIK